MGTFFFGVLCYVGCDVANAPNSTIMVGSTALVKYRKSPTTGERIYLSLLIASHLVWSP